MFADSGLTSDSDGDTSVWTADGDDGAEDKKKAADSEPEREDRGIQTDSGAPVSEELKEEEEVAASLANSSVDDGDEEFEEYVDAGEDLEIPEPKAEREHEKPAQEYALVLPTHIMRDTSAYFVWLDLEVRFRDFGNAVLLTGCSPFPLEKKHRQTDNVVADDRDHQ